MNDFRRRVVLTICLLGSLLSVLFVIRQMVKDQESENIGYSALRWDIPKFPHYTGGREYRAPSSQGSTVPMPRVSSSSQQLFHHNAGGTYAGQGTGTYRSSYAQSTGRPVRTFANGAIHSYGGGGSGGGMSGVTSHSKTSYSGGNAGYATPSISISIPRARSYAYNSISGTASETPTRQSVSGRKKVKPARDGEFGEVAPDTEEEGKWWYWDWDEWDWTTVIPTGTIRYDGSGNPYRYDGSGWVLVENQANPDSPIGDVPWIALMLMLGGYAVVKSVRRKMYEQE